MKLKLAGNDFPALQSDALILVEFEESPRPDAAGLAPLRESGEISGKFGEFTLLHSLAGFKSRRVLIARGGKREKPLSRIKSSSFGPTGL